MKALLPSTCAIRDRSPNHLSPPTAQSSPPPGAAAASPPGRPTSTSTPQTRPSLTLPSYRRGCCSAGPGRCWRRRGCLRIRTTRWSHTTCRPPPTSRRAVSGGSSGCWERAWLWTGTGKQINTMRFTQFNTQVRQSISAAAAAAKQRLGLPPPGARPGAWSTLPQQQLGAKLEAAEARQRQLALTMSPTQWELEQRTIQAMRTRTAFLRNPRYRDAPTKTAGGSTTVPNQHPRPARSPSPAEAAEVGWFPFEAEPSEVVFGSYEVGQVYSQTLRVRNTGLVMRGVWFQPPASRYFHVSLPRWVDYYYMHVTASVLRPDLMLDTCATTISTTTGSPPRQKMRWRREWPPS
jgi:hypothetical protein